ncbi:hypothetical protein [Photobacterium leiognathi]|uniref:hypothetical protein n=1 Tax=Photobacterium leiognathi TaxID=553611 RepID=UPI002980B2A1|nr:hypothetical protein [Photobacterium leiognathi]
MSLTTKAFFIALPIAILLQAVILLVGFVVWGEHFHVSSTNIIGILSGVLVFFKVKKYLKRKDFDL